jgi:hypothetical protein
MRFADEVFPPKRASSPVANNRGRAARRSMSNEHKAALARGREEGLVVRRYLEGLESARPRRGRRRTTAGMQRRLRSIDDQMPEADPLARLHLLQQKQDLEAELRRSSETRDLSELEKQFIKVARSYGDRKGITYATWRAAGVPPSVLQSAGISRARS